MGAYQLLGHCLAVKKGHTRTNNGPWRSSKNNMATILMHCGGISLGCRQALASPRNKSATWRALQIGS